PSTGFFGQAGVRFGMIYASLFGASSLALAAFLWWSTAGLLDRQNEAAIAVDAQGLLERYGEGGLPALIDTIEQRIAGNIDAGGRRPAAAGRHPGALAAPPAGGLRRDPAASRPRRRAGSGPGASRGPGRGAAPAGRPRRGGAHPAAQHRRRRHAVGGGYRGAA